MDPLVLVLLVFAGACAMYVLAWSVLESASRAERMAESWEDKDECEF